MKWTPWGEMLNPRKPSLRLSKTIASEEKSNWFGALASSRKPGFGMLLTEAQWSFSKHFSKKSFLCRICLVCKIMHTVSLSHICFSIASADAKMVIYLLSSFACALYAGGIEESRYWIFDVGFLNVLISCQLWWGHSRAMPINDYKGISNKRRCRRNSLK